MSKSKTQKMLERLQQPRRKGADEDMLGQEIQKKIEVPKENKVPKTQPKFSGGKKV